MISTDSALVREGRKVDGADNSDRIVLRAVCILFEQKLHSEGVRHCACDVFPNGMAGTVPSAVQIDWHPTLSFLICGDNSTPVPGARRGQLQ